MARILANVNLKILLVDLTCTACPSIMIIEQNDLEGITVFLSDACKVA